MKTAALCWKHGISDATFSNWKAKYGGMTGSFAGARGREPPAEEASGGVDARRVGAEGLLEKKLTRSAERYAAVEKLIADHAFSERRARRLIGVSRPAWQYEPLRGKDDAVRERSRRPTASQISSGRSATRSPFNAGGIGAGLRGFLERRRPSRGDRCRRPSSTGWQPIRRSSSKILISSAMLWTSTLRRRVASGTE